MNDYTLVQQKEIDVLGKTYRVSVYCRPDGRHFAQTHFAENDIIISDGETLEEVLSRHERLIPLAIHSRQVLRDSGGFYRRRLPTT